MAVVWRLYGGCTVVLKVAPPEKTARAVPFPRRPHESPRCTAHMLRGCQRTAQVCLRRQSQEGRCLHFAATPRRPNAYYRVAGRGFHSVIHPPELDGRLGVHDLELVRWYPKLTRRDETRVHRACAVRVGEFHPVDELERTIAFCEGELGGTLLG